MNQFFHHCEIIFWVFFFCFSFFFFGTHSIPNYGYTMHMYVCVIETVTHLSHTHSGTYGALIPTSIILGGPHIILRLCCEYLISNNHKIPIFILASIESSGMYTVNERWRGRVWAKREVFEWRHSHKYTNRTFYTFETHTVQCTYCVYTCAYDSSLECCWLCRQHICSQVRTVLFYIEYGDKMKNIPTVLSFNVENIHSSISVCVHLFHFYPSNGRFSSSFSVIFIPLS